jgi:hypothetical protein
MTIRPAIAVPCVLALLLGGQSAAAENFALGPKAGTTGLGLEATLRMSEAFNLRGGFYAFDYSTDIEENGIQYDGDLELSNAGLFADWHPFAGTFRVSVGGVQSANAFGGAADGELEVGDNTYLAQLQADVDWDGFAPYLGVGWGNAVGSAGWSFSFDLGVMFTGEPSVSLTGTVDDPLLQPDFDEDLAREEESLRQELEDARYFPVINLGLAYRF